MARQPEPVQRSSTRRDAGRLGNETEASAGDRAGEQQLADKGAGNDDAFIDVKRLGPDIGAAKEIGRRLARGDAFGDPGEEHSALGEGEARIGKRIDITDRQMERFENKEDRFVHSIGVPCP